MWPQLAQMTNSTANLENKVNLVDPVPADYYSVEPVETSYWHWLWFASSGWLSLFYFALLIWMVIYCVKHDPERFIWLWIIFLTQPFGPFIYFIVRWLPSSNTKLPAFTQKWTKAREIRQLETAALQIGNAHQHIQYGDALKNVGKIEVALKAYRSALSKEPDNLAALWGAASMEFRLDQFDSAKEKLEKVLSIESSYKFGDVSLLYGKTLGALQQKEDALAHFEKHIRKWRQPEAMYLLANLYLNFQRPDQARESLQGLIIDIDSSPKAIARKHLFWKSRAKKLLRKIPNI